MGKQLRKIQFTPLDEEPKGKKTINFTPLEEDVAVAEPPKKKELAGSEDLSIGLPPSGQPVNAVPPIASEEEAKRHGAAALAALQQGPPAEPAIDTSTMMGPRAEYSTAQAKPNLVVGTKEQRARELVSEVYDPEKYAEEKAAKTRESNPFVSLGKIRVECISL